MSHRIEISPDAQRDIRALPAYVRAQALQMLHGLADNPRPLRASELRDRPSIFRLWLARRWRIVYTVEDDTKRVLILRVRAKERIDYNSV